MAFVQLPPELRIAIYEYAMCPTRTVSSAQVQKIAGHKKHTYLIGVHQHDNVDKYNCSIPALAHVGNSQTRREVLALFLTTHTVEFALWRRQWRDSALRWLSGMGDEAVANLVDVVVTVDVRTHPPRMFRVRFRPALDVTCGDGDEDVDYRSVSKPRVEFRRPPRWRVRTPRGAGVSTSWMYVVRIAHDRMAHKRVAEAETAHGFSETRLAGRVDRIVTARDLIECLELFIERRRTTTGDLQAQIVVLRQA